MTSSCNSNMHRIHRFPFTESYRYGIESFPEQEWKFEGWFLTCSHRNSWRQHFIVFRDCGVVDLNSCCREISRMSSGQLIPNLDLRALPAYVEVKVVLPVVKWRVKKNLSGFVLSQAIYQVVVVLLVGIDVTFSPSHSHLLVLCSCVFSDFLHSCHPSHTVVINLYSCNLKIPAL